MWPELADTGTHASGMRVQRGPCIRNDRGGGGIGGGINHAVQPLRMHAVPLDPEPAAAAAVMDGAAAPAQPAAVASTSAASTSAAAGGAGPIRETPQARACLGAGSMWMVMMCVRLPIALDRTGSKALSSLPKAPQAALFL